MKDEEHKVMYLRRAGDGNSWISSKQAGAGRVRIQRAHSSSRKTASRAREGKARGRNALRGRRKRESDEKTSRAISAKLQTDFACLISDHAVLPPSISSDRELEKMKCGIIRDGGLVKVYKLRNDADAP